MSPEIAIGIHRGLIGRSVQMRLEEHPYKKKFTATVRGIASKPGRSQGRLYLMKLDETASKKLSTNYLLFYPQYVQYTRSFLKKHLKPRGKVIRDRSSLEELILDPREGQAGILGRVYESRRPEVIEKMTFTKEDLFVLAYGFVEKPKE